MGVFEIFKIVQMVPNREKRLIQKREKLLAQKISGIYFCALCTMIKALVDG